jgi:hypothetical protein
MALYTQLMYRHQAQIMLWQLKQERLPLLRPQGQRCLLCGLTLQQDQNQFG